MKKQILFTLIAMLSTGFCLGQQVKRNMVANSCFEEGLKHWYTSCYPECKVQYSVDSDESISGATSALIYVDRPGGKPYDAMLYTLFPLERNAKYKISFKIKSSESTRLILEFCPNHGDYTPPLLEIQPESFKSENNDNRMRGTIEVTPEVQEYSFVTQVMDNADWYYKLGFQFANAPQYTLFWIDDVKICRADEGDWDGNLFPAGDFEDSKIYLNDDFAVSNQTDNNTSLQVSSLKPVDGEKSYRLKGISFDLSVPYCPNEGGTYALGFTMLANHRGEILNSVLPDYDPNFTIAFGNENELARMNCSFLKKEQIDMAAGHTIERMGRWNLLLSNFLDAIGAFEVRLDNITVKETNLELLDFEIVNLPFELKQGETYQLKIGEFVTPTHADPKVVFSVENGKGAAIIDQNGLLTGNMVGDITVKVAAFSGKVVKSLHVNIVDPTSIGENRLNNLTLTPTIVTQGDKVCLNGLLSGSVISLYSSEGRRLSGFNENLSEIDTSGLSNGLFIVRIEQEKDVCIRKFLVK